LFGVAALDVVAYASAAALLGAAVLVSLIGPLRRALRVDPVIVLRSE
jgi:ABC-type antimicrobial peptide transport system permease subunit